MSAAADPAEQARSAEEDQNGEPLRPWQGTLGIFLVALVARCAVVAWAAGRFPPSGDGFYYDVLAQRLAEGHGYTWQAEDGSIAPAAHYPVGYPALLALGFALAGPHSSVAMLLNALLGALGAAALHRALLAVARPRWAFWLALFGFALHPALLGYTAAIMTEGVCATFLAAAAWLALHAGAERSSRRLVRIAVLGGVLGLATLVRPQLLLLIPALVIPACSGKKVKQAVLALALCSAAALTVVAPWTARNCAVLDRCALVSVNGGWNLLIGTDPDARGTWAELRVPESCADVTLEAAKDRCFASAAAQKIRARPAAWLALAPLKLATTFNHVGAAPWYLQQSNPRALPVSVRFVAAGLEQLWQRVLTALALLAASANLRRRWGAHGIAWRAAVVLLGLALPGWVATLLWCALALAQPWTRDEGSTSARLDPSRALVMAGAVVGLTAVTHVVFFGAGRYGLVVIPFVVLAAGALRSAIVVVPDGKRAEV